MAVLAVVIVVVVFKVAVVIVVAFVVLVVLIFSDTLQISLEIILPLKERRSEQSACLST